MGGNRELRLACILAAERLDRLHRETRSQIAAHHAGINLHAFDAAWREIIMSLYGSHDSLTAFIRQFDTLEV